MHGWLGVATMVLAFTPPAFFFAGLIWRDILFADVWLFAAALTYATTSRPAAIRWPAQTIAMLLVGLGVLLRPNAIIAAPLLAAYVMWPAAFHWKRVALILIPGIVAGYALIHTVYYTVLNAERLYPLHSVFVFDLGGITYYSGENRFPVEFTPDQNRHAHRQMLQPGPLGLLLAHPAVRFRDAAARAEGRQDLRHAATGRRLAQRRPVESPRLPEAPRDVHGPLPQPRRPADPGARPQRAVTTRCMQRIRSSRR